VVAFSKKLRWLDQTKVISLKTQLHAVNACVKRSLRVTFTNVLSKDFTREDPKKQKRQQLKVPKKL